MALHFSISIISFWRRWSTQEKTTHPCTPPQEGIKRCSAALRAVLLATGTVALQDRLYNILLSEFVRRRSACGLLLCVFTGTQAFVPAKCSAKDNGGSQSPATVFIGHRDCGPPFMSHNRNGGSQSLRPFFGHRGLWPSKDGLLQGTKALCQL